MGAMPVENKVDNFQSRPEAKVSGPFWELLGDRVRNCVR